MSRKLTRDDHVKVRELHEKTNLAQKDIAKKVGLSPGAICYILKLKKEGLPIPGDPPKGMECVEIQEEDYSKLTDDRIFNFKDFVIF